MDIEITDGIAIIMIIVYSIVFLGYVTSNKKLRKYKGALIAGYFMRIGLLFLDIYGKKSMYCLIVGMIVKCILDVL